MNQLLKVPTELELELEASEFNSPCLHVVLVSLPCFVSRRPSVRILLIPARNAERNLLYTPGHAGLEFTCISFICS
jgi:hypothetical protein